MIYKSVTWNRAHYVLTALECYPTSILFDLVLASSCCYVQPNIDLHVALFNKNHCHAEV